MAFSKDDERFMRRALELAQRGVGKTSPNPAVGAVVRQLAEAVFWVLSRKERRIAIRC